LTRRIGGNSGPRLQGHAFKAFFSPPPYYTSYTRIILKMNINVNRKIGAGRALGFSLGFLAGLAQAGSALYPVNGLVLEVLLGVFKEAFPAPWGAEIIGLALVLGLVHGLLLAHGHPAHRVSRHLTPPYRPSCRQGGAPLSFPLSLRHHSMSEGRRPGRRARSFRYSVSSPFLPFQGSSRRA